MRFFYPRTRRSAALGVVVACFGMITGCFWNTDTGSAIEIPKAAVRMTVAFSWGDIAACTHESPEIQVAGIPDNTVELDVRLKNITVPAWNHGGGRIPYDGTDRIPANMLDLGYNGPCPMPGERNKYEFSVMALDGEGAIIGFGKAAQIFPVK